MTDVGGGGGGARATGICLRDEARPRFEFRAAGRGESGGRRQVRDRKNENGEVGDDVGAIRQRDARKMQADQIFRYDTRMMMEEDQEGKKISWGLENEFGGMGDRRTALC